MWAIHPGKREWIATGLIIENPGPSGPHSAKPDRALPAYPVTGSTQM